MLEIAAVCANRAFGTERQRRGELYGFYGSPHCTLLIEWRKMTTVPCFWTHFTISHSSSTKV